jgi:hypothetical protein
MYVYMWSPVYALYVACVRWMHGTHLGFHAPPRVNQLPMVTDPIDFHHVKEVSVGKDSEGEEKYECYQKFEEGANNLNAEHSVKFQKWFAKKQPEFYIGFDHKKNMKNDPFLDGLTKEEKKYFQSEMAKIWKKNRAKYHQKDDMWYMIVEGQRPHGTSAVGLFQEEAVFKAVRDEEFNRTGGREWSLKGCWFHDLEDAKNYIQMARDEEGVAYAWPETIRVLWKKGPLTKSDEETWGDMEEVDFSE